MKLNRKEKRAERTLDLTHLVESDEETPQTKRPRQRENVQRSPDGSVGGSGRKGVGLEEKIVSSGNNFESRGRRESHGEEYDTDAEEEAAAPIADIRYYNGTIKTISYKISFSPTPAPSSSRSVAATSHGSITVEGMIGPTSRKLQRVLLLSFDFDLAEFLKKIPDHVPLLCVTQNEPRILRNLERERGNVYWFESPGANAFCSQHAKALVVRHSLSLPGHDAEIGKAILRALGANSHFDGKLVARHLPDRQSLLHPRLPSTRYTVPLPRNEHHHHSWWPRPLLPHLPRIRRWTAFLFSRLHRFARYGL